MKNLLTGLLGFLLVVIILAIFQSWSLWAVTFVISFITYFLFFPSRYIAPYAMLTGALIALAIIDTGRIGREALLGVVIYGIVTLFHELLRFTSEYGRFIVAVTLMTLAYPLLMLPWASYFIYLPQLVSSILLAVFLSFIIQQRRPTDYELV